MDESSVVSTEVFQEAGELPPVAGEPDPAAVADGVGADGAGVPGDGDSLVPDGTEADLEAEEGVSLEDLVDEETGSIPVYIINSTESEQLYNNELGGVCLLLLPMILQLLRITWVTAVQAISSPAIILSISAACLLTCLTLTMLRFQPASTRVAVMWNITILCMILMLAVIVLWPVLTRPSTFTVQGVIQATRSAVARTRLPVFRPLPTGLYPRILILGRG